MARPKKNTPEIVEQIVETTVYTPEQREIALKKKVATDIKKLPVVDAKLAELKEKFKDMKIDGVDDKKGYAAIKSALSELTGYRTATGKKADEITQDYKDVVKGISAEAKRIIDELHDIEQPLRAERKRHEEAVEAEKKRIEEEKKKALDDRITELKGLGLVFDGQFYTIGNIAVDLATIQKMADDKFLILTTKAQEESKRLEEEEAEREKIREQEREKARIAQEEQEAERKRLEDERLALKKQQEEQAAELEKLRKEKEDMLKEAERVKAEQAAEIERMRKEADENAKKLEREKIEAKVSLIGYRLEQIGLMRVGDVYNFYDNVIGTGVQYDLKDAVNINSNEDIDALVKTLQLSMSKVTEKRLEHDRALEEKRKAEQEAKRKEDERLAAEKEALRLAALPDVEKIKIFVSGVLAAAMQCPTKDIKNDQMAKQLEISRDKICEILTDLNTSVDVFTK